MFCTKCGKQLPDGAKFCTGCGNQIMQSDAKQPQPQQGKMQSPTSHESNTMILPQMQQPNRQGTGAQNIPNRQTPNMSYHPQKTQETKQTENKNKSVMIVLSVILVILVIVAIGMAVYYFAVLSKDSPDEDLATTENMNESSLTEEDDSVAEPEPETEETIDEIGGVGPVAEQEEISDTNEVVKGVVLNVPKATYSYDFDDDLGNAQVVTRNQPETIPEIAEDKKPQYVTGIDGEAVYLDGSYGIRLSDVQGVGTSYTVAFWMKADTLVDWAPFIHIGYNLLDNNQRCRLWLGQKTDEFSVAPIINSDHERFQVSYEIRPTGVNNSMQTGVWYHIVFTVDGARQGSSATSVQGTLYVAGKRVGEGDIALDTMDSDDLEVYLGINCWDELYPIAFDGVKIWNQVLDAGQVEELFEAY